jgi:putative membrane protein
MLLARVSLLAVGPRCDAQAMAEDDVTRRTWLAAERTWLAWWRTALGASVAALGVGALAPQLTEGAKWPWILLGAAYGLLSVAMFVAGTLRHHQTRAALEANGFSRLPNRLVDVVAAAGALLAAVTVVLVVLEL